jgi:hypothetical protein
MEELLWEKEEEHQEQNVQEQSTPSQTPTEEEQ